MVELQLREKEIFETLKKIKKFDFVVIGGYAVNAYTLPRFSADCDIVVKDEAELGKIKKELEKSGYKEVKANEELLYHGNFKRFEKEIQLNFSVSIDILIQEVLDRQTNSSFLADWIFENSKLRNLRGKTINEELKLRIINPEALFVMKMLSCRQTDIRDIFLLATEIKNNEWVKKEVESRYSFKDRIKKIKKEINSNQFKDGLQGVFGIIDKKIFERNIKLISNLDK